MSEPNAMSHEHEFSEIDTVEDRLHWIESQIASLYQSVPFGSHSLASDGTYTQVNALQLGWLESTLDKLIGKCSPFDFLSPASKTRLEGHMATFGEHGFADLELTLQSPSGKLRPISLSFNGFLDATGRPQNNRFVSFDLSAVKQISEKQRIAAIAFESLAGICVTDSKGIILQVNQAFTALTGYSAAEAVGQTMHLLSSGHQDKAFYRAMWAELGRDHRWQGEIYNRRKDGQIIAEWLSISAICGADGNISNYIGTFYDITANKAAQEQVSHMAYFDMLTQLPNRRLLQDRLTQSLAAMQRSSFHGALLFIDLDNFKDINDSRGHDAGDLLLIEAARRLEAGVREGDSVARMGGDEFVVLLEQLDEKEGEAAQQARQIGKKLLLAMAMPYQFSDFEFRCSASIGISLFNVGALPAVLLQQADLALYQAKKLGKNTLRFFDPLMQAAVTARSEMEQALHRALELGEFQLRYQPQVDQNGRIVAAEALLRWFPSGRQAISPADFIPLAEESGLILPIGAWVLEMACAQLCAWQANPMTRDLKLGINVSPRQFLEPDFTEQVVRALEVHGVNPALLQLEVTENLVLDVADAIARMNALRNRGVTFSMDDFGTGYSSLSSLTKLPLDQLKIDKSFVRNMKDSPTDATIVRTIIAMAQSLGLEVIAEGVETDEQQAFLAQYGCNLYQGFLFSAAVDAGEFENLIALGLPKHQPQSVT